MMSESCNCFDEVFEKLKEHIQKQIPKDATEFRCSWKDRVWVLSGGDYAPVTPKVEFEYRQTKKNGDPAKNLTKGATNVHPTHCCFCGRKYNQAERG